MLRLVVLIFRADMPSLRPGQKEAHVSLQATGNRNEGVFLCMSKPRKIYLSKQLFLSMLSELSSQFIDRLAIMNCVYACMLGGMTVLGNRQIMIKRTCNNLVLFYVQIFTRLNRERIFAAHSLSVYVCDLEVVFLLNHSLAGVSTTKSTGLLQVLLALHLLVTNHLTPQEVLSAVLHGKEPHSTWGSYSYILSNNRGYQSASVLG